MRNLCHTLIFIFVCSSAVAQETVFQASFDYAEPPVLDGDAAALNGGIDQIGSFSGMLPGGDGKFEPNLIGFVETIDLNPDPMILIDRPLESGQFFADFTTPIALDGAKVAFEVALRRSSGESHVKDYDMIGLDHNGNESFHLRFSAFSGETEENDAERIGFVSDNGQTVNYDLPTVDGEDDNGDFPQAGKPPYEPGKMGLVELTLGEDGFSVYVESELNLYTTDILSYNGDAENLSQIAFTFAGDAEDKTLRSGYVLDDIVVTGEPVEVMVGPTRDCNEDGELNVLDANCTPLGELDDFLSEIGLPKADLDGDGEVAFSDFLILSESFGGEGSYTDGDIDKSGTVEFADFLALSENFGISAGAQAIPEPSSLQILWFAISILALGKRSRSQR